MYRRILVPTDGSPLSRKAIAHAIAIARSSGATIIGLYARRDPTVYYGDGLLVLSSQVEKQLEDQAKKAGDKYLSLLQKAAQKAKVRFKGIQVSDAYPSTAIIRISRKEKCDLIAMASHGRKGISRVLLGSETMRVLADSRIPVLVTR
jgi:nucleotide-binding universal stress UspA family protein